MNRLELCNVSVSTLPLVDVIPAAAAAGFTSISVLDRPHRKSGVSDHELAKLFADHGITVQEVEAAGDWLAPPEPHAEPWLNNVYGTEQLLAVAEVLGAATLLAVHFGPPRPIDDTSEAFARLCDRAAERGVRVALEYVALATIADLATAWRIVQAADRPNGGLLVDLWHHRRGGSDDARLDAIPADRIFGVQLSDGPRVPSGTLIEDIQHRLLPGQGEFGAVDFVRHVDALGIDCPIGIEVYDPAVIVHGAAEATRVLHDALSRVVVDARQ